MRDEEPQPSKGRQPLRPRARILRALGDELISSETVAIVELVKNSYDADATRVLVQFAGPFAVGDGVIAVLDNGHGMALQTIRSAWLEPATAIRKQDRYSEKLRRRVLGEKGIGRFAAAKLADTLDMVTRRSGEEQETRVYLDWREFDRDDLFLDQVRVDWLQRDPEEICPGGAISRLWGDDERSNPGDQEHGTLIRLGGLRAAWADEQFKTLRTTLSRLISPFASEGIQRDFQIRLSLPEDFAHYSGTVQPPEILGNPPYSIRGYVDADGAYDLEVKAPGQTSFTGLRDTFDLPSGNKPACGPFWIDLRAWDRDAPSLKQLAQEHGSTLRDIRRDLDEAAGISLYRDQFRVLPYGEPHNDWLRLDLRRVQNPTLRLSNNQIVGYVHISSEANPGLRDQSNREGLIDNQAFEDLRQLVTFILADIETRRYAVRHPEGPAKRESAGGLFAGITMAPVLQYIRQNRSDDTALLSLAERLDSDLTRRVEDVQTVLSRYRSLATLGSLIDTVLHDGRAPVAGIRNEAEIGLLESRKLAASIDGLASGLVNRFDKIRTQSGVLSGVFKKIEPFGGRKRGRPAKTELEKIVSDAFALLATETAALGTTVQLPDSHTEITADPAELQQVFVNLLQNSLHWLRKVPKPSRRILVLLSRPVATEVEILFSDSGPGISHEFRERIFEPYFSTKPEGVGLGLAISGEIIREYYEGTLELVANGPLPGATFRIVLRKRV